jgi:hypothetical protein
MKALAVFAAPVLDTGSVTLGVFAIFSSKIY